MHPHRTQLPHAKVPVHPHLVVNTLVPNALQAAFGWEDHSEQRLRAIVRGEVRAAMQDWVPQAEPSVVDEVSAAPVDDDEDFFMFRFFMYPLQLFSCTQYCPANYCFFLFAEKRIIDAGEISGYYSDILTN